MRSLLQILFLRLLPFLILLVFVVGMERLYSRIHTAIINLGDKDHAWLTVPTGAAFAQVKDSLYAHNYIRNRELFENYMRIGQYESLIKPGRYRITHRMTIQKLADMLIRGLQTPVRVTFHHIRNREELAGKVSRQIEADSLSLILLMNDRKFLEPFGVTPATLFNILLPNTYEMWWNTPPEGFFIRMAAESGKFWDERRLQKADSIGLSVSQVVILASILEKETSMDEEKPIIAGVYLNRLRKKWPLQADPTLIYAWNDFTIKRVLNRHKKINSPYNTYKHPGLPPGPICLPSISSIDAVLNSRRHNYLYFCAKEDFSGYHVFSDNLQDHSRNARKYQQALNELRIDN